MPADDRKRDRVAGSRRGSGPTTVTRPIPAAIGASLLLLACSHALSQQPIPQAALDSCVATRNITGDNPVGHDRLRLLIDRLTRDGASVRWKTTRGQSGIVRIEKTDQLTHATSRLALEVMVEPAAPGQGCAQLATVTRVQIDGQVLDAYNSEDFVLSGLQAAERDTPAANSAGSAPAIANAPAPVQAPPPPAGVFLAADRPPSGKPQLGTCHMGSCSWSIARAISTIQTDERGRLVQLTELGGTSADQHAPIVWDKTPNDVVVFCSLRLPAVIVKGDTGWQVDALDFVNGPPDVEMSSAATYATVCHGSDGMSTKQAMQLGYQPIPEDDQDIAITSPAQIFDNVPAP